MKRELIIGRQYGRKSDANRAIRNYCKRTGQLERYFFVNRIDEGCHEIDHMYSMDREHKCA